LDPRGFSPSGDLVRQYCSGRASADLDWLFPTVIELVIHAHAAQSGMGGLEAIQGNYSRLAVALESLTEEGLGGGDVTRSTVLPCLSTER
jgi:hypothetical protein